MSESNNTHAGYMTQENLTVTYYCSGLLSCTVTNCVTGLLDSPLCRKCGVKEETLAHILCECETLASLRHMHLGSFFLEPENIKSINMGAIWNFSKVTGLPWFDMGHKGPVNKA
jgi:hypothetical protein